MARHLVRHHDIINLDAYRCVHTSHDCISVRGIHKARTCARHTVFSGYKATEKRVLTFASLLQMHAKFRTLAETLVSLRATLFQTAGEFQAMAILSRNRV